MGACALTHVDWQALATFAAGLMAVGAALWVGVKQSSIQARQIEILEGQNKFKKAEINIGLLDRRLVALRNTQRLILLIGENKDQSRQTTKDIVDGMNEIRLIFSSSMFSEFQGMFQNALHSNANFEISEFRRMAGDSQGYADHQEQAFSLQSQVVLEVPALLDAMVTHARVDL